MRMILAVLALCAFVPAARAAGPDCRAIESTSGRLACYDAAFPPRMVKPVAVEKDAVRTEYKDPFLAEEARPRFDSLRAQTRPCQAAGQCPTHRRGPHGNRSAPGTFQSDRGGHRRHVGSSEFYFRSEDEGGH